MKYLIIDIREIDTLNFTKFLETKETLNYNNKGTMTVVKYNSDELNYNFLYTTKGPYNIDEIRIELLNNGWTEETEDHYYVNPD